MSLDKDSRFVLKVFMSAATLSAGSRFDSVDLKKSNTIIGSLL